MHEDPQIPHFGKPNQGVLLKPGMVITIEPMLNMGDYRVKIDDDGWTARTVDGSLSAQYEHTVAITEEGPLILTEQIISTDQIPGDGKENRQHQGGDHDNPAEPFRFHRTCQGYRSFFPILPCLRSLSVGPRRKPMTTRKNGRMQHVFGQQPDSRQKRRTSPGTEERSKMPPNR